jgi:hypothetical protein
MGGVLLGVQPMAVHPAAGGDKSLDGLAHPGGHGVGRLRRLVQEGGHSG